MKRGVHIADRQLDTLVAALDFLDVWNWRSPARDQEMDGSHLIVVWYQEEFGPPSEGGVLWRIQSIDWEASAVDFEY